MKVKTVGRSHNNNIVIKDDKVSRIHMQIAQDDNGNISVVDVGSLNGTYVNEKRIAGETFLREGDVVRIGETTLPWQSYFPPVENGTKKTPVPIWVFIVGGVLLLSLVGGGALLHEHNKKVAEAEKERIEILKKEREAADAKARWEEAKRNGSDEEVERWKKQYEELNESITAIKTKKQTKGNGTETPTANPKTGSYTPHETHTATTPIKNTQKQIDVETEGSIEDLKTKQAEQVYNSTIQGTSPNRQSQTTTTTNKAGNSTDVESNTPSLNNGEGGRSLNQDAQEVSNQNNKGRKGIFGGGRRGNKGNK